MDFTPNELALLNCLKTLPKNQSGWFLDEVEEKLGWQVLSGQPVFESLAEKGLLVRAGIGDHFIVSEEGENVLGTI